MSDSQTTAPISLADELDAIIEAISDYSSPLIARDHAELMADIQDHEGAAQTYEELARLTRAYGLSLEKAAL